MKSKKFESDWGRRNWHIAAHGIACKADAIGAGVYVFPDTKISGSPIGVLAHDKDSAEEAVKSYLEQKGNINEQ